MTHARNAVAVAFALNGFAFASWVSRIPEARSAMSLTPGQLGGVLLALSAGAVVALPSSGWWVHRYGAARVVAGGAVLDALGLVGVGLGAGVVSHAWVTAAALFVHGFGAGVWDVAMNVEGAEVERRLSRALMPRFHAAFSLGTVAGAGLGAGVSAAGVPIEWHLGIVGALVLLVALVTVRYFLPAGTDEQRSQRPAHSLRSWAEPRTLLLGLMVLAMALTEGVANDWLAVALVDGYDVPPWIGAAGFALFVAAMTAGRVGGTVVLDRFGRVPVLWTSMTLAGCGVLLVVFGTFVPIVVAGIVLWGLGAALGFPVGMSAAADDPARAAARVSVVATIGYTAFLAGPPLFGYLGDQVGVLRSLLLLVVLLIPSALAVPAARRPT